MSSKKIIFSNLSALAVACGQAIETERIRIYTECLAKYPEELVLKAIEECLCSCKFFPALSEIIQQINQNVFADKNPIEETEKIINCVKRIGPYRIADAREDLGDLWQVVERWGGWLRMCEITSDPSIRAQLRELVKVHCARKQREFSEAPMIIYNNIRSVEHAQSNLKIVRHDFSGGAA